MPLFPEDVDHIFQWLATQRRCSMPHVIPCNKGVHEQLRSSAFSSHGPRLSFLSVISKASDTASDARMLKEGGPDVGGGGTPLGATGGTAVGAAAGKEALKEKMEEQQEGELPPLKEKEEE